jgi:hypothetical protein
MQEVPIESFQVSNVENNAMALCDRPIIERIRMNDGEKIVGLLTGVRQLLDQRLMDRGINECSGHRDLQY